MHSWPESAHLVLDELRSARALVAISVAVPHTTIRRSAREQIRAALRETLGALLHRPAASISLISRPGRPLWVDLPDRSIGLSVSYAAISVVAAIHLRGAIGVDVMPVEHGADWMSDWEFVVQNYPGTRTYGRIAGLAPQHQARAFAQAWTRFEACLKCLGLELTEWHPALERGLASCCVRGLVFSENMTGSIATNIRSERTLHAPQDDPGPHLRYWQWQPTGRTTCQFRLDAQAQPEITVADALKRQPKQSATAIVTPWSW